METFSMTIRSMAGAIAAMVLLGGCSSSLPKSSGVESSDGGPEASVLPPGEIPLADTPVWKATSAQIEIRGFGFFSGSFAYVVARDALTAEQRTSVEGLRLLAAKPTARVADIVDFGIRIVDANGDVAEYRATEGDALSGDESAQRQSLPSVAYRTLQPFLNTIHCLGARATPFGAGGTAAPTLADADLTKAPTLPQDTGCSNGLFVPYDCSLSAQRLDVPAAATYRITPERCFERTTLHLFRADDSSLVVESPAGTACQPLERALTPGSYWLLVNKANASGCPSQGTAGDQLFRVTKSP
jgi:hypothetical protein